MATEKQIAANRQNALMSTGPRSLAGKQRSSQNAIRHGLTARHPVMPGEDETEFAGLKQAMISSLDPQGALEIQLVERAASLLWRLRRIPAFELALFQWAAHLQAELHDGPQAALPGRNDPDPEHVPDLHDPLTFGRMFEALLSADLTGRLGRYETTLQRQLSQTLQDLQNLQRPRRERDEALKREAERGKVGHRFQDPEDDPAYWAAKDRERMMRMDPP